MKNAVLKITLYKWYEIKNDKKNTAEIIFLISAVIAGLVAILDIIKVKDKIFLEPLIVLAGLTGVISYVLLSFCKCLILRKRKIPFWITALLAGFLCVMSLYSVITDTIEPVDGTFTYMWIYLAVLSVTFSYNSYQIKLCDAQQSEDE